MVLASRSLLNLGPIEDLDLSTSLGRKASMNRTFLINVGDHFDPVDSIDSLPCGNYGHPLFHAGISAIIQPTLFRIFVAYP